MQALLESVVRCDSVSRSARGEPGTAGPMLRPLVDTICTIANLRSPDLDSRTYEDKGAKGFQPVPDSGA